MSHEKNNPELDVVRKRQTLSWYLLRIFVLVVVVGALVIGFVIHYRSVIPIIPAPQSVPTPSHPDLLTQWGQWLGAHVPLVFGIIAGIAVLVWIAKKALWQSRSTQAEEDRKRLRTKELESYLPPGSQSVPEMRRESQLQTFGYGLCLIGALFAIHLLLVPLLSQDAQEWEKDFISRSSVLPFCFYGIIALLTLSLFPMVSTGRRLLRFIATAVAFVVLGTGFLLFKAKIPPSTTASFLIELWEFLWQPVLVPHGWLFLFGAPLVIMVAKYFANWDERGIHNASAFYLILGLNVWALFYFHNPS